QAKTENAEESKGEPLADHSEPKPEESTAAAGEELAPGISELEAEAPVEPAEPEEEEKAEDNKVAEKAEETVAEKTEEEDVKTEKTEAAEHPSESSL
ncbi:putative cytochrome c1-like, partial [Cocos nucifera]